MEKVKKILEGYVEWIALAVGTCFLMWMVYSYVYLPPVTVAVGQTQAVLPGQIDTTIWETQGKSLKAQIDDHHPPLKVAVPAFSESVAQAISRTTPDTAPLDGAFTVEVPTSAGPQIDIDKPTQTPDAPGAQVAALPIAPKPLNPVISTGHSNTLPAADPSTGTAAAVAPAVGQPAAPGMPPIVPPSNGGVVPVANAATDKGWVTVAVTVPSMTAMNAEFTKSNIPAQVQLRQTTVLRVELFREEMDASGNWGPETLINPPPIDVLPAMPPPEYKVPSDARLQRSYLDFAGKDAPLILRPAFYQIVQGDKWYVPGAANPNVRADELVTEKFDPATYTGKLDDLSKEDRDAVQKARADQRKLAAAQKAAAQKAAQLAAQNAARANRNSRGSRGAGATPGGPGAGGAGPGGGGGFVVTDAGRPTDALAMADGPTFFDAPPAPVRPPGMEAMPGGPSDSPGMAPGGPTGSSVDDLPKGSFDPAVQKDFTVWAHDETVKPGKSYRYRIRYSISSPVYATQRLCKPQSLAAVFTITSEKSDWTAQVNVESDANFYASAIGPKGSVTFDVFKWQGGVWTMKTVDVNPGDAIIGTDWTVVDVRDVPNDPVNRLVILASDNGILQKEIKADRKIKKYHELVATVKGPTAQQPGAGPMGPGNPGSPPMLAPGAPPNAP